MDTALLLSTGARRLGLGPLWRLRLLAPVLVALLVRAVPLAAQPLAPAGGPPPAGVAECLARGGACQARFEREPAAAAYRQALRLAPNCFEALCNLAVLTVQMGFQQPDPAAQQAGARQATSLAARALRLDSGRYEAHYAVALAAGAAQRNGASSTERLAAGRTVRWHAGRALALNPRHAESWALLGAWHLGLANLNWAEHLLAGAATTGASNDEALRCFRQALRLQPGNVKLYLMAATACQHLRRPAEAQTLLRQALALPLLRPEDPQVREKCLALLHELAWAQPASCLVIGCS